MRIDWTNEAETALDELYDRLSAYSNAAAARLVARINLRVAGLAFHPRKGRIVPEYNIERFRELIEPPYRIMYQVFADRVEIATIRHSAELLAPGD